MVPPPEENPVKSSHYKPLESVWQGQDAELIERMLAFYPRKPPKKILDATVNGGRFWRESSRSVIGIDIEIKHKPAIVADNTCMPFADGGNLRDHRRQTGMVFQVHPREVRLAIEKAAAANILLMSCKEDRREMP
jgi:hypothetical protein